MKNFKIAAAIHAARYYYAYMERQKFAIITFILFSCPALLHAQAQTVGVLQKVMNWVIPIVKAGIILAIFISGARSIFALLKGDSKATNYIIHTVIAAALYAALPYIIGEFTSWGPNKTINLK